MNDIRVADLRRGKCHLVLLHGWGLKGIVWHCIRENSARIFTLHLVDSAGYGVAVSLAP